MQDTVSIVDPLSFQFQLVGKAAKCDVLEDAIKRYKKLIFATDCSLLSPDEPLNSTEQPLPRYPPYRPTLDSMGPQAPNQSKFGGILPKLVIEVDECPSLPREGMIEEYTLSVRTNGEAAYLTAKQVWGALRGLETFSQMIFYYRNNFWINTSLVYDFPRFSFRGLLIDTSRHFIPVKIILDTLDAMSYDKLNVLHWHITDDPSFPYQSKKFPQLSQFGAFSPEHVYSQEDIEKIIDYARKRGIRVVSEFDVPGHTKSWGKAIDGLLSTCYAEHSRPNGDSGPMNPTKTSTYQFLEQFFAEVVEVFPDDYVHIGGDEVNFDCWKSSVSINDSMRRLGIEGQYEKLQAYFEEKVIGLVERLGKQYLVWDEVFETGVNLTQNGIVHVWRPQRPKEMLSMSTKAGFRAILSAPWYLDLIEWGPDWQRFYLADPHDFDGDEKQKKLVIGGATCTWGEYVDGINLLSRTW